MSISSELFVDLCKSNPKSAQLIKQRCLDHLEHLSLIRSRKEHLHPANYFDKYLVNYPIKLEKKAPVNAEMTIDFKRKTV